MGRKSRDMSENIKSSITLALAIYGVIQIWLIALWNKYIRKGTINIYETGNIEIGYSNFGPTIGLNGTLRALNKDVFVRAINLLVVREKDKAQHIFQWMAFRPPKIDLAGSQPISMEIPSGFMISSNSPHRFNIFFNDNGCFGDIRYLFGVYISEWYKVVEQLTKIGLPPQLGITSPEIIVQRSGLIQNFEKSSIYSEMYAALNGRCYWESGDYRLTINVVTSKPDKVISNNYHFSITEDDSRNLKLNVVTMLRDPIANYLGDQNFPYHFAYAAYKQLYERKLN